MKKTLNTTSGQEYEAPVVDVTELKNSDVLTVSGPDNREIQANQFNGNNAPRDLLDSIFGN